MRMVNTSLTLTKVTSFRPTSKYPRTKCTSSKISLLPPTRLSLMI